MSMPEHFRNGHSFINPGQREDIDENNLKDKAAISHPLFLSVIANQCASISGASPVHFFVRTKVREFHSVTCASDSKKQRSVLFTSGPPIRPSYHRSARHHACHHPSPRRCPCRQASLSPQNAHSTHQTDSSSQTHQDNRRQTQCKRQSGRIQTPPKVSPNRRNARHFLPLWSQTVHRRRSDQFRSYHLAETEEPFER